MKKKQLESENQRRSVQSSPQEHYRNNNLFFNNDSIYKNKQKLDVPSKHHNSKLFAFYEMLLCIQ